MQAGIPTYATPEEAVSAFMQTVHYRRNQAMLMQVPLRSNRRSTTSATTRERVIPQARGREPQMLDRGRGQGGARRVRHTGGRHPVAATSTMPRQRAEPSAIRWRSRSCRPTSRTSRTSAASH